MKQYIFTGCFILLDIVTGLIKALYKKELNSTSLRKGLYAKLTEILSVAVSAVFERGSTVINLGIQFPLSDFVMAYVCLMELISVTENLCEVNPKLFKIFRKFLEKVKDTDTDAKD